MTRAFFKSIRFMAVLWYVVFLLIILSIFSFLLYESFKNAIYNDLDDLLSSKADGIANSIDTYLMATNTVSSDYRRNTGLTDETDRERFIAIAGNWVEEKRKDPQLMSVFAQILDIKGDVLISSKSMPKIPPFSKEDYTDILNGEDDFDTTGGESAGGRQMKFRVYTRPVMREGEARFVVQVLTPASLLSIALNNLKLILFILLPLTVILAAVPGIILMRLTLRPVRAMIDTSRRITAENLKLKIHMPDTKDEIAKLAHTFNDMIDRIDRSFSSQQRFIRDISGELKIPLDSLKRDVTDIMKGAHPEEEYKAVLDRSLKDMDNFSKVIEELETLSHFDNSQEELEIKKVNLARLIEHVLNEVKAATDEKDIAVSFSCSQTIILDGDEEKLKRLLTNILDNAVKYTYRKGSVTVSAHKSQGSAKIIVTDTGIGIPGDEIDYIFDRFHQVSRPRASNHGFGLGLSMARCIALAHKGNIKAESAYGKGSSFIITLPLSYPV